MHIKITSITFLIFFFRPINQSCHVDVHGKFFSAIDLSISLC